PPAAPPPSGGAEQAQAAIVLAIVQATSTAAGLPVRLCGGRSDAEDLVAWFAAGAPEAARDEVALACGWRLELAGAAALAWLRGETSLAASASGGVAIEPRVVGDPSSRT
ncbi:MAG TPA: hypothetical protein VMZ28_00680, partial [Kofleriaceae bacterium]|nr:hypothetical protein [Kofleriaceae bacterium]